MNKNQQILANFIKKSEFDIVDARAKLLALTREIQDGIAAAKKGTNSPEYLQYKAKEEDLLKERAELQDEIASYSGG